MKKFISKYSQQVVIAVLFLVISASIASATWPITLGFIRNSLIAEGGFLYGYGFTVGNVGTYGYGYSLGDRANHYPFDYAGYGFVGTDGSTVIDNISVTQTTAVVAFTTPYLSRAIAYYNTSGDHNDPFNAAGDEQDYNSGSRTLIIDNLACGTLYYVALSTRDATGRGWLSNNESLTTLPCNTVVTTGTYGHAQTFGTMPIGSETPSGDKPLFPESPRLDYADFGPGPKLLQTLLNHLGFKVSEYGPGSPGHETEFFGPKTRAALKKFQKAHGLNPDGIYGELTKKAMEAELNK